jgi:hypothetical protein
MDLHTTVENMFAPARHPGLVGVELELIPVTDTPLPRPVAPVWLAAGFDAGFVRAAAPTFEPGGQLDAQPLWRIPESVGVVTSLLYDDRARHDALDLLLPRAQDQHRAWTEAATGYSPEAEALLAIARAARPAVGAALASGGVA